MEALKAEINRKRKLAELAASENSDGVGMIGTTRFMRQCDIIKAKEKTIADAQKILDDEKEARMRIKRQEEEKQNLRLSKMPDTGKPTSSNSENLDLLTAHQIKHRLRALGQPITLFGEDDISRVNRLSAVKSDEQQNEDDYRFNSASGAKANNLNQQKDDEDDEDEFDEEDKAEKALEKVERGLTANGTSAIQNDSDEDDEKKADAAGPATGYKINGKRIQFSKIPNLSADKIVYKYFRSLLKEWEWDLNARKDTEKTSSKGKMDTQTQKQCKDYIRPLFKQCKRKEVEEDILEKLLEMVQFCEEGNFRVAHDRYISLAIGNAAWPIGLTMVGIHERSGREKISTAKVAHVMNNELSRKYLTSVKRLMTYAQKKRPDVPPSMKVL